MKIILDGEGVKRALPEGGFSLCGSKADLQRLAQQITDLVNSDFCYGWIAIHPPFARAAANTKPLPWADGKDIG